MTNKAVVVLSGGQDSVTCLAWAVQAYPEVEAITFNYGQRHETEIACSSAVCRELGVKQKIVDLQFFGEMSTSALTGDGPVSAQHSMNSELPASFVPNRNALFFTLAHAWAQTIGATDVISGVCQTDYSGYPDCRQEFVESINSTLNLGAAKDIRIITPLMHLTKGQTFAMAADLGPEAMQLVLEMSHTCYEGDRSIRHAWGYGCGTCPACELRAKGWEDFITGES